jgi:hypothetical protein
MHLQQAAVCINLSKTPNIYLTGSHTSVNLIIYLKKFYQIYFRFKQGK